jgi:protein-S-isoprenylcysteine O-methyltransferase Ste14
MIEYRSTDFATPQVYNPAATIAACVPPVFFGVLAVTWLVTNNWLAGFVFLFSACTALGAWWEDREIRALTSAAVHAGAEEQLRLNAHYAEIRRRTPDLLRAAVIIAAIVPALVAYA